nr:MAG TPA: hypothetical protein [Caudoviricetes sp.]
MTIEELMTEKLRMEQRISDAIKEFEGATSLKVENMSVVRCTISSELGFERDYKYNVKAKIDL